MAHGGHINGSVFWPRRSTRPCEHEGTTFASLSSFSLLSLILLFPFLNARASIYSTYLRQPNENGGDGETMWASENETSRGTDGDKTKQKSRIHYSFYQNGFFYKRASTCTKWALFNKKFKEPKREEEATPARPYFLYYIEKPWTKRSNQGTSNSIKKMNDVVICNEDNPQEDVAY